MPLSHRITVVMPALLGLTFSSPHPLSPGGVSDVSGSGGGFLGMGAAMSSPSLSNALASLSAHPTIPTASPTRRGPPGFATYARGRGATPGQGVRGEGSSLDSAPNMARNQTERCLSRRR